MRVFWIPSHVGDNLPESLIIPAFAAAHSTTVRNILFNRIADAAAKQVATAFLPIQEQMLSKLQHSIFQRQFFWLNSMSYQPRKFPVPLLLRNRLFKTVLFLSSVDSLGGTGTRTFKTFLGGLQGP